MKLRCGAFSERRLRNTGTEISPVFVNSREEPSVAAMCATGIFSACVSFSVDASPPADGLCTASGCFFGPRSGLHSKY